MGKIWQQYLLHMSHNMANFGPLAAEIDPVVWGTPANFNGFRVLAALLHGTPVVGVSQTFCGVEQRASPIFGRAAITLGIGPHSSSFDFCSFPISSCTPSLGRLILPFPVPRPVRPDRSSVKYQVSCIR